MARIRSSPRGKSAAVEAVVRDIDFKHLWRQLRGAGWTAKRPSGIQNEWSCVSPGGGESFVGEGAVVAHVVETGLLVDVSDDKEEETNLTDPAASSDVGEAVRASQIDTTTQLSQNTIEDLFGVSSDDDVELSQAAVTRAFDLSPSDLQAGDSDRDAATSLQFLSEASGPESDAASDDTPAALPAALPAVALPPNALPAGTSAAPAAASPASTGRVLRPRVKKDINFVAEDEDLDAYESFSSGESDPDVVVEGDDEAVRTELYSDDEDALSDGDAVLMDEAFVSSLMIGEDRLNRVAEKARADSLRNMEWSAPSSAFETGGAAYPGLNMEEAQPTLELRSVCHSPLLSFFYFMPKSLWVMINAETTRYGSQQVERRAQGILARQPDRPREDRRPETIDKIRQRLMASPAYQTHEILHVLGLLIARMMCPQKRHFSAHWSMSVDGAIPAGTFGLFMGRNRCQAILRDLHFVDNEAERTRDKLWKLRPIVDKLQQRFMAGWSLPAVFSFDEGVLPSTSKRNTTRMFMPDKPHRYGFKMFMLCDSRTAYCHRFEMYAGKRHAGEAGDSAFDHKTGAAAVVRNLKAVLETATRHTWHLVVIDRFYSSILLAIELLGMSVYVIGTIMADRLGFDKNVRATRKTRSDDVPRGAFTFSRSVAVPDMIAYHWWDNKPVHYLCTGSAMTASSINRNVKRIGAVTVPCPASVNDYQRWMGGVDVHDQLRLQTFSLQTSTKFKKYYKSLFLGFVDLALVNAFISHKETSRLAGTTAMSRGEWYAVLQNQLLQLRAADFAGVVLTPPPPQARSANALLFGWHMPSSSRRTVSRISSKKKSFSTTYFCERCSVDAAKCWLCNRIRHEYIGEAKTCFAIWHDDFDCGRDIPAALGKKVVLRRPAQDAGKRKKTCRELALYESDADDEESKSGEV